MKKQFRKIISLTLAFAFVLMLAAGQTERSLKVSAADEIQAVKISEDPQTFCNPLNISYQYQEDYYSREGADPAVAVYRGEYYLFVSHSSGYWWSKDLKKWEFIPSDMPEINKFAPAVCVYNDTLYLTHSNSGSIYKTTDPKSDNWEYVSHPLDWDDPALFADDDGRVYCYYGCSDNSPIMAAELDPQNNMSLIGEAKALFNQNRDDHGFETGGDNNEKYSADCWLEGAWMFKHNGRYYLQYAVPGTQYAAYADGCYVSDSPMGDFTYCDNSPVSFKNTGFSVGAGHGSLFEDLTGRLWKLSTVAIGVHHMFERRIMMTPAAFTADGKLITASQMADYPTFVQYGRDDIYSSHPDWNLISYNADASASSFAEGFEPSKAADESIRTWWSAQSGSAGEWLMLDLSRICELNAFQVNFADQDIENTKGRNNDFAYNYTVEFSLDKNNWYTLADHTGYRADLNNAVDTSHDYYELEEAVRVRYVRITNRSEAPAGGKFSLSGLRLFGNGRGIAPDEASGLSVTRSFSNPRSAKIEWQAAENAEGYIIRYGTGRDCLSIGYQVIGECSAVVNNLNIGVDYWFAVDSYNDSGYTKGSSLVSSVRLTDDIHIEAENYDEMFGVQVENCDEGGKDIAYYDEGDWMTYTVRVKKPGEYKLILRGAAPEDGAVTKVSLYNEKAGEWQELTSVEIKNTGSWQSYESFYADSLFSLSEGEHKFRFTGTASGSNINWFELIYQTPSEQANLYISKTAPSLSSAGFGDYTSFYTTVRNIGEGEASGGFEVEFYVDGRLLETVPYSGNIAAGRTVNISTEGKWRAADGSHTVKVFVNYGKSLPESNYADNVFKSRFVVL